MKQDFSAGGVLDRKDAKPARPPNGEVLLSGEVLGGEGSELVPITPLKTRLDFSVWFCARGPGRPEPSCLLQALGQAMVQERSWFLWEHGEEKVEKDRVLGARQWLQGRFGFLLLLYLPLITSSPGALLRTNGFFFWVSWALLYLTASTSDPACHFASKPACGLHKFCSSRGHSWGPCLPCSLLWLLEQNSA